MLSAWPYFAMVLSQKKKKKKVDFSQPKWPISALFLLNYLGHIYICSPHMENICGFLDINLDLLELYYVIMHFIKNISLPIHYENVLFLTTHILPFNIVMS